MNDALPIEDLSKTYLEHSMVINNFVIKIGSQNKDSLCRVFGDGVQYEWRENDDKIIIPDVSIICNLRDRKNISFTGIPRFVMEVLSNATEDYDRHEKMDIYCKVGVSEYWIVDWRKKSVEIYLFDFREDEPDRVYDYIGVVYPEGFIGNEYNFLFDHDNITDVIFRGYENPERNEFIEFLTVAEEAEKNQNFEE